MVSYTYLATCGRRYFFGLFPLDAWRKLTRYTLDGKRVNKSTPGAIATLTLSREWYGLVRGQYVKLSPLRDRAERLLRKRLGDAEDLRLDRFASHRQAPLADHVEKFREHLEAKGCADRYVTETIAQLNIATANCQRLEHVTADRIAACLNDLAKQGRGLLKKKKSGANERTRNAYLTTAKNFCQWCVRTTRLPDNPLAHVSKLKQIDNRHERRTLAAAEFGQLISAAEQSTEVVRELSGTDRAMLYTVAAASGLRASEIASPTVESLMLDREPPFIIVEATDSNRRKREEQPIPTWLADQLRVWLAKRPSQTVLTIEPQKLWPGSWRRHAAEMLRSDLAAAEIFYRDDADRVFDFHALRHQYISNLAAAGVHPSVAQGLARHSSIDLTMNRYTHVALHNVVGAVESLSAPEKPADNMLRATGTDDRQIRGDAQVTVQASSNEQKPAFSDDDEEGPKSPMTNEKPVQKHGFHERRARDSNPQPVSRHLISSQAANHSLTLRVEHPIKYEPSLRGKISRWFHLF